VSLIWHLHAPTPGTVVAVHSRDVESRDALAEIETALRLEPDDVTWTRFDPDGALGSSALGGRRV
jgi:Na+-translocating ferredoxin:NAD+ oxidoreductase RnfC subunit